MKTAVGIILFAVAAQAQEAALQDLVDVPALADARIGVYVKDLDTGVIVLSHAATKGFMTASNMKLITAAVALMTLGPDYRYRTSLIATSRISDGSLAGDLVLLGSGDPSFGHRRDGQDPAAVLDRMVRAMIERTGLRHIAGRIIGDDNCQPDELMGEGWSWGYQSDSYAAQISGLCFAENIAVLDISPATVSQRPTITAVPDTAFITLTNQAITTDSQATTTAWARRQRATNLITVGGRIAVNARGIQRSVSIENPTEFAACALRESLIRNGVGVDGPAVDRDDLPDQLERYGDESLVAEHDSPPLHSLLVTLNKYSQNLYAEQLGRTAARHALGQASMTSAAAQAKRVLAELGVDPAGMRIADASGLTRLNLVHPRQLVELLTAMWQSKHRELWMSTLPIAGIDGTLQHRFHDTPAAGKVRAKTGYISGVIALSGYIPRKTRAPLAFSILVNNFTCATITAKAAVDRFVIALTEAAGD